MGRRQHKKRVIATLARQGHNEKPEDLTIAQVYKRSRGGALCELEEAVKQREREEEFRKQHGPVRQIMKDGKLL